MFEGKQIRDKRRSLNMSAEQLARKINVNVNNLYKWEKGHRPHDPEDYMKIENWLAGGKESVTTFQNVPTKSETPQNGEKSEILDIMRERIQDLKQDKEWLKKNLEFSLTGLAVGQKSILAHVSTILEKDDEREAAGNKKKEQTLKDDTGRRIGDKFSGSSQMDTSLSR